MESVELLKLLDVLKELDTKIDSLKELKPQEKTHRSTETNELFAALATAQKDIKAAGMDEINPYFQTGHETLLSVVEVSREPLSNNGLSVIQQILTNDKGQNILHTILGHSSGQWIETEMNITPHKSDIQSLGSYLSCIRRYCYEAIVGVVVKGADDDGEHAVSSERKLFSKGTALNTKYDPRENKYETISKEQLDEIEYEIGDYPDIAEVVLNALKLQSLADMPKDKFLIAISRIRKIKNLREGK